MDVKINEDILELEGIEESIRGANEESRYLYNGNPVPRVTIIIKHNQDQEGLIKWAAGCGYRKFNYYRDKACDIGTIVHESIDGYLTEKYKNNNPNEYKVDYEIYSKDYRSGIYNAYENFKLWDRQLENLHAPIQEVIGLEIPVVCPWYGGTIDGIVRINNATYIIDFKTSKEISFNYLVQTAAYMWIINNGYAPELPPIDGIGIIRVDKNRVGIFNDLFLNNFITNQRLMIESYQQTFVAYVNSYYRSLNAKYITDNYVYNPIEFFRKE